MASSPVTLQSRCHSTQHALFMGYPEVPCALPTVHRSMRWACIKSMLVPGVWLQRSLLVQAWQMNIGQCFVEVDARILPAPSLQYKEGTQPMNTGSLGAWNLKQVPHSHRYVALPFI